MTISGIGGSYAPSAQELWAAMQGGSATSSEQAGAFDESVKQKLMDEFDADGDGELNADELASLQEKLDAMQDMLAMMHQMRMGQGAEGGPGGPGGPGEGGGGLLGELMQELQDSGETEAADADGDGVVSPEELMDYFGIDPSQAPQGPPAQGASESADDGDGASAQAGSASSDGSVSAAAASGSSSETEEADLNGDGVVTFAEWMEYVGMSSDEASAQTGQTLGGTQEGGSMARLLRQAVRAYRDAYGTLDEQVGQGAEGLMGLGSVSSVA